MSRAGTTVDEVARTRGKVMRVRLASFLERRAALVSLLLLFTFASFRYESFLAWPPENLVQMLGQNSILGLLALGMTFAVLSGGLDLSVGALLAAASVIAAGLAEQGLVVSVSAAIAATTLLGFVSGAIIAKARLQPFIVTLAMMFAIHGLVLAYTNWQAARPDAAPLRLVELGRAGIGLGALEIPLSAVMLFVAFVCGWLVLRHTRFGRHVYAVGDDEEAARLMGLNVERVTMRVYALSGGLAGTAGVLLASQQNWRQPLAAIGWELDALIAVLMGGTLLKGGTGGTGSTLIGVFLLAIIFNSFELEGSSSRGWQLVLRGIMLLAIVIVQSRLTARER
jgi:galactofuranose transport system permease protein